MNTIAQQSKNIEILATTQPPQRNNIEGNQFKNRLLSLDVMRGMIMIFLAGESCLVYVALRDMQPNQTVADIFDFLFQHHPWHGLHLWDLIQPGFMLMAGS